MTDIRIVDIQDIIALKFGNENDCPFGDTSLTKFISLRVRNALVLHGYTPDNKEVMEEIQNEPFVEKLISVDRIQSATEKYLLVTSSHGRVLYWEYEGGLSALKMRFADAGLVIA